MITRLTILVAILTLSCWTLAQQRQHEAPPADQTRDEQPHAAAAHQAEETAHPLLSPDATWAGVMVIVIIGAFFLPAAVIGPIARALAPEEEPITESHDEPPGSSHRHGPEGTQAELPGHGH